MEPEKKSNGAFVGVIIIILILIVGGIYIWQAKVKSALEQKKAQKETVKTNDISDLDVLEKDLNAIDTNVEVDVNAIN
ncbi:MAG: hypothetical protein WC822_05530 [Candidatus Paceibacterota bacterium]|jgi:hypothetical protein